MNNSKANPLAEYIFRSNKIDPEIWELINFSVYYCDEKMTFLPARANERNVILYATFKHLHKLHRYWRDVYINLSYMSSDDWEWTKNHMVYEVDKKKWYIDDEETQVRVLTHNLKQIDNITIAQTSYNGYLVHNNGIIEKIKEITPIEKEETKMKKCKVCGKLTLAEGRYCAHCGVYQATEF